MDSSDDRTGPGEVMVFCCSGTADVGEIGHRASSLLDERGVASRFCLAGIGGGIDAMLRKTRQASRIVVIDGCRVSCARRTLERAGFSGFGAFYLGELGMEKGQSPVTPERVEAVIAHATGLLAGR